MYKSADTESTNTKKSEAAPANKTTKTPSVNIVDNRPEAIAQLKLKEASINSSENSPIQRFLSHKGKQYKSLADLSGDKTAFDFYFAAKNKSDFTTKLDDTTAVYNIETLEKTDEAPEAVEKKEELKKVMAKDVPKTADIIAKEKDADLMKEIAPKLSGVSVVFTGSRWDAHLTDMMNADGTALIKKQDIAPIINKAVASEMHGAGPGKNGGLTLRIVYNKSKNLSVVFEYFEKDGKASVFHVGPGG